MIRKLSFLNIFFVILVAETIVFRAVADVKSILCATIETTNWALVGSHKTCYINKSTSISTPGYKIDSAKDETITGFHAQHNKNLFYLPDSPHEQFPNLQVYGAWGSSVKEISSSNFKNLNKLRVLWLNGNQIEKISSDTFSDLESLEWLYLSKVFFQVRGLISNTSV
jgi:uncharacterized protein YjiK